MNLLLDSHVALWMLYEPERLSSRAAAAVSQHRSNLVVSYATLWELTGKTTRGKLPLVGSSIGNMMRELEAVSVALLRIRRAHILAMEKLEMHHGDPFDRMLIAQAQVEGLTLVTADATLRKYGVPTFW